MQKLVRTLLCILDGAPGAGGLNQRGQSLLELALISPLLILMFIGIVEIGWYANHVLILMEVTRVGARAGTVASGQLAALNWQEFPPEDNPTIHPFVYILDNGYAPIAGVPNDSPSAIDRRSRGLPDAGWRWTGTTVNAVLPNIPNEAFEFRQECGQLRTSQIGFYNYIACTMLNSMQPLKLHGRAANTTEYVPKYISGFRTPRYYKVPYPDDIVVSVFGAQLINYDDPRRWDNIVGNVANDQPFNSGIYARTYNFAGNSVTGDDNYVKGIRVRVVARYPATANECNVRWTPTLPPNSNDSIEQTINGPAQSENDYTLDVKQPFIERILGPLASVSSATAVLTDSEGNPILGAGGNVQYAAVDRVSQPIPAGNFLYFPDQRDPFDYIPNKTRDTLDGRAIELAGYDDGAEIQRGFVWTGQHYINDVQADGSQTFCIGSDWDIDRVEAMMNLPQFLQRTVLNAGFPNANLSDYNFLNSSAVTSYLNSAPVMGSADYAKWQERAAHLPGQGLVLAEIFWSHDTLLDFPFLRAIYTMFGDSQRVTISVWAAFPVPNAEPNIIYQLP